MAIERNDRSFSTIFDEVDIHTVPTKYILSIIITMTSGEQIEIPADILQSMESADDVIAGIERENISGVDISLDYEAIKTDVTTNMKSVLDDLFDNHD